MRKFGLLGTSALGSFTFVGLAMALATPAYAQDTQPAASDQSSDQRKSTEPADPAQVGQTEVELESGTAASSDASGNGIVVTGSRIRRPNLESTVPITSVGPQELLSRGDVSLGDALNELPSLRATYSQANSTRFIGTAGLNLLDLRGLGTSRTLVLVNGRRHVTVSPGSYEVDVNTIPTDLLERVDVVTGGNSAIYGSDAVAGVVNFILKKDFEGIELRGQGGVTSYGDRGSYFASLLAGKNFFDGRFNVTFAGEYARTNPVFFSDRPYVADVPGFITTENTATPNRNFNGIPNTGFVPGGIRFGNISLGGYLLQPCPASQFKAGVRTALCTGQTTPTGGFIPIRYAFLPNGELVQDIPTADNRAIGGGVLGGLSATGVEGAMLLPGLERYTANVLMSAELSPAFKPFLEAKYVHVNAQQTSTQPTFIASTLSPFFYLDNPFLSPQAVTLLNQLIPNGQRDPDHDNSKYFQIQRFNNDFGTRSENHKRDTYRIVFGVGGDLSSKGNLRYEVSFNYGRTETFYRAGGNVDLAKYDFAVDAIRDGNGNIVCRDPAARAAGCAPLNVFGNGAPSRAALDYILVPSERNEWAEQKDATAFISADSTGFFELPGGPVGIALGVEYREEDAYSAYDEYTAQGNTFLNGGDPFDPPKLKVKEAFGELRIPLLKETPFFQELSIEAAARVSDYGGKTGAVWAYNAGVTWAPVRDLRFRASYARSVRAPTLGDLYATSSVNFANGLTDPCDQPGGTNSSNNITTNPNRAKNCLAAGVPTTITYTDSAGNSISRPWSNVPGSGVQFVDSGNPNLVPEIGKSLTIGGVFQPRFIPGFSLSIDYYRIKVNQVISGLTGQAIVDRCYDDPTGINNPFCDAVFRRTSADPLANLTFNGQSSRRLENRSDVVLPVVGPAFLNAPFNFAQLRSEGIDFDAAYRTRLSDGVVLNMRSIVTYLLDRESFSYLTQPDRSDRLHGTFGYPRWAGSLNLNLDFGMFDISYNPRYVGRQTILAYETQFTHQGRGPTNPDARPFKYYPDVIYHNFRLNFEPAKSFNFYMGVDNVLNRRPPYDLTGTEGGSTYSPTGRMFYAGATARF
jgi:outer membrane receptor protein involved in Fe transport